MATLKHTHTYVRGKVQFGELHFRCAHPDCTHSARVSMVVGKRSICAVCGQNELILPDQPSILSKIAKPRCLECSQTKEARQRRQLLDIVGGAMDAEDPR